MADLYQHDPHKLADAGLQLRVPPDLIPPAQYAQLTNALPIIEGRIEGRAALAWQVNIANPTFPGAGVHSLTRLNQPAVAAVGDRIAGIDTTVQTLSLPSGTAPTQRDTARTGDPLALPNFHFNADTAAWQIIADRQGAKKYRGGSGTGYYVPLGVAPPQNPIASSAAGAAGNPNNGSGPPYDWVYTHVFTPTLSESNPSFAAFNGNEDVTPASNTTPDPNFGGSAAPAISNTTVTAVASSASESRQSALWTPWGTASSQPYSQLFLDVAGSFTVTGTSGVVYGAIYFTVDGGATWRLYVECSSGTVTFGIPNSNSFGTIQINPSQDLTKLQVRAVVLGCGNVTAPQNVIARRIRQHAGNFSIPDLLVGANGTNRQITLSITTLHTHGVQLGASVAQTGLTNQKGVVCILDPRAISPEIDAIRLYRRGGAVTASWAFVQQYALSSLAQGVCGAGQLEVDDNVADANLGQFVSLTNDAPVTSVFVSQRPLPYLWGPAFNPARILGCGDPDRPDAVYFSNPGDANQWPPFNWIDVSSPSDPMQGGCVFNTRVFAFSKERMFELVQGLLGGATLTPFATPCSRGLISPWGLLSTARAVYFVAKDGIYSTDGGVEQSLVENDIKPLFPTLDNPLGRSVEGYDAVNLERIEDIRLRFHNDELYFIYRGINTNQLQMLVYDQNKTRWRAATYPVSIATIYSEEAGPASSLLLGDTTGSIYATKSGTGDLLQSSTVTIPVTVRTGAFDQGQPLNQKEYGNLIIDLDPGGATSLTPVTITPYLNGEAITDASVTVTGSGRQQVPLSLSDAFGFNISFGITFTKSAPPATGTIINPVLYQYDILYRLEPVAVIHWQARETSHGLPGYQHIRDQYVALRSTTPVTLTMVFDNTYTQTYTLASTGNKRAKVYLPMQANKFKTVSYSLDATDPTQPFRIYAVDCETRVKPWVTSLGYAVTKPYGAEGQQVTEALESQYLGGTTGGR